MGVKTKGLNFDKLIKPYREGGSERSKVIRTLETISAKLLVAYKFSPEVVGAAVFLVFYKIAYQGLEFKGDGSYGSKGRELFSCIKAQCVAMTQKKAVEIITGQIEGLVSCVVDDCPVRRKELVLLSRRERFNRWMGKPRGPLWRF